MPEAIWRFWLQPMVLDHMLQDQNGPGPYAPGPCWECTLHKEYVCYMLLEQCAFQYVLEHIYNILQDY